VGELIKDKLPENFKNSIKKLFDENNMEEESEKFFDSLDLMYFRGIRYNSLKVISEIEFEKLLDTIFREMDSQIESVGKQKFKKVLWADDGYYLDNNIYPGKHPLYNTGIFYIQEPSAMLPAKILAAKPGEKILDICAAPGGKTIKIAADMKGEGILFANDINKERTRALVRNVELAGCTNCVVLNDTPEKLSENFHGYFDKILIDAPCSGEGMFRKDPAAISGWEKFGPETCVIMQKDILKSVDKMLKQGGEIVYSTCTFNSSENEEMIVWFLNEFSGYEVISTGLSDEAIEKSKVSKGFETGKGTGSALRIFPHRAEGEGHFAIKLKKRECENDCNKFSNDLQDKNAKIIRQKTDENLKITSSKFKLDKNIRLLKLEDDFQVEDFKQSFIDFSRKLLTQKYLDDFFKNYKNIKIYNGHVYALPEDIPELNKISVPKKGFYAGKLKKARDKTIFEPSHSLALSLKTDDLKVSISFDTKDIELQNYLKGQTIFAKDISKHSIKGSMPDNGYILFSILGYSLGWGKITQKQTIKNLYPAGWVRSSDIL